MVQFDNYDPGVPEVDGLDAGVLELLLEPLLELDEPEVVLDPEVESELDVVPESDFPELELLEDEPLELLLFLPSAALESLR